jgi:Holliday junction resolvase RusA-like endonuclease
MNDYINVNRRNVYAANKIKQDETFISMLKFKGVKINTPCKLKFTWYIPNKGNDLDNVASTKKFIIDGMTKAGTIKNDNCNHIIALEDIYKKGEWGVDVEWEEL